jgi:hypothetical protein
MVFVSMAFLASVLTRDKAKAIGIALLFWFISRSSTMDFSFGLFTPSLIIH